MQANAANTNTNPNTNNNTNNNTMEYHNQLHNQPQSEYHSHIQDASRQMQADAEEECYRKQLEAARYDEEELSF